MAALLLPTGCIEDPDCGICDPHNLIVQSISGVNYASRKVHLLDPECVGERCPGPFDSGEYFVEPIGRCEDSEEALASPQGTDEFCRLSPNVTAFGIEFVFNNLLEPTRVELVRRRPDNPNLFEVYDWKTKVLEIEGPITRFNGDYFPGRAEAPDLITRAVNLSCIDNLAANNLGYSHLDYSDPATNPCNRIDPESGRPMKMQVDGVVRSTRGRWDARAVARAGDRSCDSPEDGPDTCCSQCDHILATQVAKYGVRTAADPASGDALTGERLLALDNLRSPHDGSAIECDPEGDVFSQCRDFMVGIDRHDETLQYSYAWSCDPADPGCVRQEARLPLFDRLRENHPDDRPVWLERRNASCTSTAQCNDPEGHNLLGTQCVGADEQGVACSVDVEGADTCVEGRCRAPWFVTCRADPDTTGVQGYCIDTRFDDGGAGACMLSRSQFAACDDQGENCRTAPPGTRLAFCDGNEDGKLNAAECCQDTLGTIDESLGCDPVLQSQLRRVARYSRSKSLPEPTRDCICSDLDDASPECREVVSVSCVDDEGRLRPERAGEYAVKFVTRRGGVIYDPAIKGLEWRPADLGAVPRAAVEACAQSRSLITPRTTEDGWRAHDATAQEAEAFEDFDRALCSGSRYTVRFAEPVDGEAIEYVADKLGNTLEGRSEYVFETPQFRVVPNSGFPTDNLRIGACDDFSVTLSNKYDLSPENLAKLEVWAIDDAAEWAEPQPGCGLLPVAGGSNCAATDQERLDRGPCTPPCLTVDVGGQAIGELRVRVDPTEFGRVLETGRAYRLWLPGLLDPDDIDDPEAYAAAFWDACGMPLVLGTPEGNIEYSYDFGIDEPKCKEDADRDNVQFSCDNADDVFNPFQEDLDGDGVGDVIDLCPTVPGTLNNSADSDKDGIGNRCDNCRRPTKQYNEYADAGVPASLLVRNIPGQQDTDGDGIGDACDNCVRTPNCQAFGPDEPWSPGDPIAFDDSNLCQRDDDRDFVGDACQGMQSDIAAGPVGVFADDDFDQDGLVNAIDACPRQPVDTTAEWIACSDNDDCPVNRNCERLEGAEFGVCDHLDTDGDEVGDICDTCPFSANPMQVLDGAAQEDDEDGDFVGRDCETTPQCADRTDPRPFSFYEVSSQGFCCTQLLVQTDEGLANPITERLLVDPDGVPVTLDCSEADEVSGDCRPLPMLSASSPGVLAPPPGCDEALAAAGYDSALDNPKLNLRDVDGDVDALWASLCLLPQLDQDFDAVGDACDLCTFDYDPNNRAYIDGNGKLWPKAGAFCNGEYDIEQRCKDDDPVATGGSGSGSDDDGGSTSMGESG